MNERMLQLYRQAHVPHTAIDPASNMPYETTIFSANKFAELIVRECADISRSHQNFPETEQTIRRWVAEDIVRHFGVEE